MAIVSGSDTNYDPGGYQPISLLAFRGPPAAITPYTYRPTEAHVYPMDYDFSSFEVLLSDLVHRPYYVTG
jgi:hypothetical protein